MLNEDMIRVVREQRLGFVATTNPDGTPNLSPKGTFVVIDQRTIAFGDVRSPRTLRNLRARPTVEVNFVDPFLRKGYRFRGRATITVRGAADFQSLSDQFAGYGRVVASMRAIVAVVIDVVQPILSPAYDRGATEAETRSLWTTRFRSIQPNQDFES